MGGDGKLQMRHFERRISRRFQPPLATFAGKSRLDVAVLENSLGLPDFGVSHLKLEPTGLKELNYMRFVVHRGGFEAR